jgi:hypothetical protein
MAYDAGAGVSVLYGGGTNDDWTPDVDDVWTFDGVTKSWKNPTAVMPKPPPLQQRHGLRCRAQGHRGSQWPRSGRRRAEGLRMDDRDLELDRRRQFRRTTGLFGNALAYAPGGKLLEFGGTRAFVLHLGTTWLYDGAKLWDKGRGGLRGGTDPEQRRRILRAVRYIARIRRVRNVTVLFGGDYNIWPFWLRDTWVGRPELGAAFSATSPKNARAQRAWLRLEAQTHRPVQRERAELDEFGDTWEYYRYGGTCATSAECER